jgi:hypothetical protein
VIGRRHLLKWPGNTALARAVLGVGMIAAIALATVFGGQRYLYCRSMGEVMTGATCQCAQHHDSEGATSISVLYDCFDVRYLDRLLSNTAAAGLDIAGAPFVAELPALGVDALPSSSAVVRAEHPIRAGPYSPSAARSRLMVFLT